MLILSAADMETTSTGTGATATTATYSDDDGLSELRRGPWTAEEDSLLTHYISGHGDGRWNSLAQRSGLKRTGKSCRLRWLNYLKPDVKRGNLTPEEQLLILDLHSKWGNRWSKIAQFLPGRTDNEIKNYWRTRVQKQARHLQIDVNSVEFQKLIRTVWVPRLIQKAQEYLSSSPPAPAPNFVPCGSENQEIAFNSSSELSGNLSSANSCHFGRFQNVQFCNVDNTTGFGIESLSNRDHHVQDNWLSDEVGWNNFDEFLQWKQPKET